MTTLATSQLEFTDRAGQSIAPVVSPHPLAILNTAVERGADVDTLERISALAREWKADAARQQYAEAMARAQSEIPIVVTDKTNTQTNSRYAAMETIQRAIKDVYLRNGFTVTFSEGGAPVDEMVHVIGVVRHIGGHVETFNRYAPSDYTGLKGTPNKTKVQGSQATLTYLSRRLLCEIFGVTVAGEDGDGRRPAEFIGPEHQQQLRAALAEVSGDPEAFLKAIGADTFDTITHDQFRDGLARISQKKAKRGAAK